MLFNAGSGSEMEAFSKILAAQKLSTKPGIGPAHGAHHQATA